MSEEVYEIDKEASGDHIKCESCGGNMVFDPQKQALVCPHCGSIKDFEKDKAVKELELSSAFNKAVKWDDTAVLRCENCGAKVVISSNDVAKNCPYCGTTHIRKVEELAGIKPNAVYPFRLSEKDAVEKVKNWVKGKFFVQSGFKKNIDAKNVRGVYEPCFTFDSDTFSTYVGRLGERRTRTVHTKNGTRTETYIVWYNVSGSINHFFDDVTISAGGEIEQDLLNKLLPFNIDTIKVYDKDYLAGYLANHYQKDIESCWKDAKDVMDSILRQLILRRYHCDEIDFLNISTQHDKVTYKYVLMPIYILTYHYKKKDYRIYVNGNTGKVYGKAPISFWKVALAVVLGIGALVGLFFLFSGGDIEIAEALNNLI